MPYCHQEIELETKLQSHIDRVRQKENLPLSIEQLEYNGMPLIKIGDWQSSDFNRLMGLTTESLSSIEVHKDIQQDLDVVKSILKHYLTGSKDKKYKNGLRKKYQNKVIHRYFGSRNSFIKALQAKTLEHFIKRFDNETIYKYCFVYWGKRRSKAISYRLSNYYQNIKLVEEVKQDGLLHILPFVIAFAKTPQELKKQFGKGIWKQLCSNTASRNLLLLKKAEQIAFDQVDTEFVEEFNEPPPFFLEDMHQDLYHYDKFIRYIVDHIPHLMKLKSRLLDYYRYSFSDKNYSIAQWVNNNAKVSDREMVSKYFCLARDTSAYTEINPKWSLKRMQLEHDKGVKRANEQRLKDLAKKYQDKKYHQSLFNVDIPEEINGVKIKLLNCEFDYIIESIEQDHCIYDSYWEYAEDKLIVAFSLQSENQRTTAAYDFNKAKQSISIRPFQHTGYGNESVHCKTIQRLCRIKEFREVLEKIADERFGRCTEIPPSIFTTIHLFTEELKHSA